MMLSRHSLAWILLGFAFLLSGLLNDKSKRQKQRTNKGIRKGDTEPHHTESHANPSDHEENNPHQEYREPLSYSNEGIEAAHSKNHCTCTDNNKKTCFDKAILVTAFVAAFASAVAAGFAGWQALIAKQELNASQRPWVGVEVIDHGGVEIGKAFRFALRLHNYGRTPAVRVHIISTGLRWRPGSKEIVLETQKKMCGLGSMDTPMGLGPYVLFPDQEHVENSGIDLFSKEAVAQESFQGALFPFILGCITYRSTFDNTVHRTPYASQITRRGIPEAKDNSPDLNAIMIDKMPIPASMISLRSENSQGIQPD